MFACPAPLQRQVSGALEAIRDVLGELAERIAERGLEADVSTEGVGCERWRDLAMAPREQAVNRGREQGAQARG